MRSHLDNNSNGIKRKAQRFVAKFRRSEIVPEVEASRKNAPDFCAPEEVLPGAAKPSPPIFDDRKGDADNSPLLSEPEETTLTDAVAKSYAAQENKTREKLPPISLNCEETSIATCRNDAETLPALQITGGLRNNADKGQHRDLLGEQPANVGSREAFPRTFKIVGLATKDIFPEEREMPSAQIIWRSKHNTKPEALKPTNQLEVQEIPPFQPVPQVYQDTSPHELDASQPVQTKWKKYNNNKTVQGSKEKVPNEKPAETAVPYQKRSPEWQAARRIQRIWRQHHIALQEQQEQGKAANILQLCWWRDLSQDEKQRISEATTCAAVPQQIQEFVRRGREKQASHEEDQSSIAERRIVSQPRASPSARRWYRQRMLLGAKEELAEMESAPSTPQSSWVDSPPSSESENEEEDAFPMQRLPTTMNPPTKEMEAEEEKYSTNQQQLTTEGTPRKNMLQDSDMLNAQETAPLANKFRKFYHRKPIPVVARDRSRVDLSGLYRCAFDVRYAELAGERQERVEAAIHNQGLIEAAIHNQGLSRQRISMDRSSRQTTPSPSKQETEVKLLDNSDDSGQPTSPKQPSQDTQMADCITSQAIVPNSMRTETSSSEHATDEGSKLLANAGVGKHDECVLSPTEEVNLDIPGPEELSNLAKACSIQDKSISNAPAAKPSETTEMRDTSTQEDNSREKESRDDAHKFIATAAASPGAGVVVQQSVVDAPQEPPHSGEQLDSRAEESARVIGASQLGEITGVLPPDSQKKKVIDTDIAKPQDTSSPTKQDVDTSILNDTIQQQQPALMEESRHEQPTFEVACDNKQGRSILKVLLQTVVVVVCILSLCLFLGLNRMSALKRIHPENVPSVWKSRDAMGLCVDSSNPKFCRAKH